MRNFEENARSVSLDMDIYSLAVSLLRSESHRPLTMRVRGNSQLIIFDV